MDYCSLSATTRGRYNLMAVSRNTSVQKMASFTPAKLHMIKLVRCCKGKLQQREGYLTEVFFVFVKLTVLVEIAD